jgi:hypothetical protein
MTHADVDDPNLTAAVEHALAPLLHLLPPEDVAYLRILLRDELTRHPVSLRLLKQLAPAPQVERSGERGTGVDQEADAAARARVESRGRR